MLVRDMLVRDIIFEIDFLLSVFRCLCWIICMCSVCGVGVMSFFVKNCFESMMKFVVLYWF